MTVTGRNAFDGVQYPTLSEEGPLVVWKAEEVAARYDGCHATSSGTSMAITGHQWKMSVTQEEQ